MHKNKPIKSFFFWIVLIIGCLIAYFQSGPSKPQFYIPQKAKIDSTSKIEPLFLSNFIPQPTYLKESYSPALTSLSNGDFICFFYAGSSEGAPDVDIYQTRYHNGKWSEPKVTVTPSILSHDTRRYTRKIGNPAVYRAQNGKLHLFVVTVTLGGWAGSKLNHLISSDEGDTWQRATNLKLSPFIDISNSCRTAPVGLEDGGFYVPIYYEMIRCYPEILRFDKDGVFLEKIRLDDHNDLIQPALVPINNLEANAYFRNKGDTDKITYTQKTVDGGLTWNNLEKTNLEGPDSSLVVARLDKNLYIMVCNLGDRGTIVLNSSHDGINWNQVMVFDELKGSTFAYPAISVNGDMVDIVYSWNERVALKHITFNKEWLMSKENVK